jgi:hypothetical protein
MHLEETSTAGLRKMTPLSVQKWLLRDWGLAKDTSIRLLFIMRPNFREAGIERIFFKKRHTPVFYVCRFLSF